jgi:hypothetical protein
MRISDLIRKCVAFFGYADVTSGKGGITCIGTGFFVLHGGVMYLVTAKHLSHALGGDPFLIRGIIYLTSTAYFEGADTSVRTDLSAGLTIAIPAAPTV